MVHVPEGKGLSSYVWKGEGRAQRPDIRSSSSAGQTVIMRHARRAATYRRRRTNFARSSAWSQFSSPVEEDGNAGEGCFVPVMADLPASSSSLSRSSEEPGGGKTTRSRRLCSPLPGTAVAGSSAPQRRSTRRNTSFAVQVELG